MNNPTMADVIVPKSDQLNADSLLAGPQTFTIREVQIRGGQEQPVNILLEETDLAFRPCKSMSRVLVSAWGPDAKVYVGRSLTLYRDPAVKWGGLEVGGIRISHMSHIDGKMLMQLTATKGQRKPHVVMPLIAEVRDHPAKQTAEQWAADHIAAVQNAADNDALEAIISKGIKPLGKLHADKPELASEIAAQYAARRAQIEREGKSDADAGEGFGDDTVGF
jgi:hypothetical protein